MSLQDALAHFLALQVSAAGVPHGIYLANALRNADDAETGLCHYAFQATGELPPLFQSFLATLPSPMPYPCPAWAPVETPSLPTSFPFMDTESTSGAATASSGKVARRRMTDLASPPARSTGLRGSASAGPSAQTDSTPPLSGFARRDALHAITSIQTQVLRTRAVLITGIPPGELLLTIGRSLLQQLPLLGYPVEAKEFIDLAPTAHYQPHEGAHVGLVIPLSREIAVGFDGCNTLDSPRLFTTVCGLPGSSPGRGPKGTEHRGFVHVQPAPAHVPHGAYLGTCVGLGYLRGVPCREDLLEHVVAHAREILLRADIGPADAFVISNILDPGANEIRGWRHPPGVREHLIVILAKPGTSTDSALARAVRRAFQVREASHSHELFVGHVPVQFVDSHAAILRAPHLPDWIFQRDGTICELTGIHDQLATTDVVNLVADHLTAILPEDLFFILRSRGYMRGARPGFTSLPDRVTVVLKSFHAPGVHVSTLQDLAATEGVRVAWGTRGSFYSDRQLDKIKDWDRRHKTRRLVDIYTGEVAQRPGQRVMGAPPGAPPGPRRAQLNGPPNLTRQQTKQGGTPNLRPTEWPALTPPRIDNLRGGQSELMRTWGGGANGGLPDDALVTNHVAEVEARFRHQIDAIISAQVATALAPVIQRQEAQAAEIQAMVRHLGPAEGPPMADTLASLLSMMTHLMEGVARMGTHGAASVENPAGSRPGPKPPDCYPGWITTALRRIAAAYPDMASSSILYPAGSSVLLYWCLRALTPDGQTPLGNPYDQADQCSICFDPLDPAHVTVRTCGHTTCEACAVRADRFPCGTCQRRTPRLGCTTELGLVTHGDSIIDQLAAGFHSPRAPFFTKTPWCTNYCGIKCDDDGWHCANCAATFCSNNCLAWYEQGDESNVGLCSSCCFLAELARGEESEQRFHRAQARRLRCADADLIFNFVDHAVPWYGAWAASQTLSLHDEDYLAFVADPDWRIRFLAQFTSPGTALDSTLFISRLYDAMAGSLGVCTASPVAPRDTCAGGCGKSVNPNAWWCGLCGRRFHHWSCMLYTRHGAGWGVCGACASNWLEFTPEAPTYVQAGRIVVNVALGLESVAREIISAAAVLAGHMTRNSLTLLACPTLLLSRVEEEWHVDSECSHALMREAGPAFSRSRGLPVSDLRQREHIRDWRESWIDWVMLPPAHARTPYPPAWGLHVPQSSTSTFALPSTERLRRIGGNGLNAWLRGHCKPHPRIPRPIPRGLAYRLDELYWTVRSEEQVCQQDHCGLPADAAMCCKSCGISAASRGCFAIWTPSRGPRCGHCLRKEGGMTTRPTFSWAGGVVALPPPQGLSARLPARASARYSYAEDHVVIVVDKLTAEVAIHHPGDSVTMQRRTARAEVMRLLRRIAPHSAPTLIDLGVAAGHFDVPPSTLAEIFRVTLLLLPNDQHQCCGCGSKATGPLCPPCTQVLAGASDPPLPDRPLIVPLGPHLIGPTDTSVAGDRCQCGFCNARYGPRAWMCRHCGNGMALPTCLGTFNGQSGGCPQCIIAARRTLGFCLQSPQRHTVLPPNLPPRERPRAQHGYREWSSIRALLLGRMAADPLITEFPAFPGSPCPCGCGKLYVARKRTFPCHACWRTFVSPECLFRWDWGSLVGACSTCFVAGQMDNPYLYYPRIVDSRVEGMYRLPLESDGRAQEGDRIDGGRPGALLRPSSSLTLTCAGPCGQPLPAWGYLCGGCGGWFDFACSTVTQSLTSYCIECSASNAVDPVSGLTPHMLRCLCGAGHPVGDHPEACDSCGALAASASCLHDGLCPICTAHSRLDTRPHVNNGPSSLPPTLSGVGCQCALRYCRGFLRRASAVQCGCGRFLQSGKCAAYAGENSVTCFPCAWGRAPPPRRPRTTPRRSLSYLRAGLFPPPPGAPPTFGQCGVCGPDQPPQAAALIRCSNCPLQAHLQCCTPDVMTQGGGNYWACRRCSGQLDLSHRCVYCPNRLWSPNGIRGFHLAASTAPFHPLCGLVQGSSGPMCMFCRYPFSPPYATTVPSRHHRVSICLHPECFFAAHAACAAGLGHYFFPLENGARGFACYTHFVHEQAPTGQPRIPSVPYFRRNLTFQCTHDASGPTGCDGCARMNKYFDVTSHGARRVDNRHVEWASLMGFVATTAVPAPACCTCGDSLSLPFALRCGFCGGMACSPNCLDDWHPGLRRGRCSRCAPSPTRPLGRSAEHGGLQFAGGRDRHVPCGCHLAAGR